MAKLPDPDRSEILDYIEDARVKKKAKKAHVRAKIEELHPQLVGKTVRRNGVVYDIIELLLDDLESYG